MSKTESKINELLECVQCKKLVNINVLSPSQISPGPGDYAYIFKCGPCNEDIKPLFQHTQKTWLEVAITALHNLERIHKRRYFSQSEIIGFVEENLNQLNPGNKSCWPNSLFLQLTSSTTVFEQSNDDEKRFALIKSFGTSIENNKRSNSEDVSKKKSKPQAKLSPVNGSSPDKNADRNSYLWCHQCKQKHANVLYCSRTCSKKYCTRCVKRHYREKVDEIDLSQWVCYYCQGVCTCAFCRRRRAKETNTKFESHRGKKRRNSEEDIIPSKKRKIKNMELNNNDNAKENNRQTKEDSSWIVEDDEVEAPEQPPRRKQQPRNRSSDTPSQQSAPSQTVSQQSEIQQQSQKSIRRRKRVTLKDLLDSHILSIGDELSFRNSENPAKLIQNGQILWSNKIFKSLSTFAKKVAHRVGAGTKGALYNGWRVVYCRGKVMDSYRKEYRKFMENKKSDEVEESSNDLSENVYEEENLLEDDDDIEDEENEGNDEGGVFEDILRENIDSDDLEDIPSRKSQRSDSLRSRRDHVISVRRDAVTSLYYRHDGDSWWMSDEEDCDATPISYSDNDLLIFGHVDSPSEEEERDLLVMGHVQSFLDLRDKDFFNVVCTDDNAVLGRSGPLMIEDNVLGPFTETVEDFYSSGLDTEYL